MKKFLSIMIIVFLVQILVGCSHQLSHDGKTAKSFLEKSGYHLLSYQGSTAITFTKKNLRKMPYRQMWAVQTMSPDPYIGKKIDVEIFQVKNHPLNQAYKNESHFSGKIKVKVWMLKGKVIGGTSFPVFKKDVGMIGGPYSLEGQTAEKVKGDFIKWLKKFETKYGVDF